MRFSFTPLGDAATTARLPVIPMIPDEEVCRLEGRNGIGKSLAVRLLELAAGEEPYLDAPLAWETLKPNLGPLEICAVDRSGLELRWRLTPSQWDPHNTGELRWEDLGQVTLNGEPATLDQVRRVFRVVRISGEEGLPTAIARRLRSLATRVMSLAERITPAARHAEMLLTLLGDRLAAANPRTVADAAARCEMADERLTQANSALDEHRGRLGRLRLAGEAVRALNDFHTEGPALQAEEHDLTEKLNKAREQQEALQRRLDELQQASATERQLAESLRQAESALRRRRTAFEKASLDAARDASALGVQDTMAAVAMAQRVVVAERKEFADERAHLERADRERYLVTRLLDTLTETSGHLPPDSMLVVADLDSGPLTAAALHAGLSRRHEVLTHTEVARRVDALDIRLAELQQRSDALAALAEALRIREQRRTALHKATEALEKVTERLASGAAGAYRAARQALSASQEESQRLAIRRVEVQHALKVLAAGKTEQELRDDVATKLCAAGLDQAADLEQALSAAGRQESELVRAVELATEEQRAAAEQLQAAHQQQASARARLRTDSALAWASPILLPLLDDRWTSETVTQLQQDIDTLRVRIDQTAKEVASVNTALGDLADKVSLGQRNKDNEPPGARAVRAAVEAQLRREFGASEIAAALFEEGQVEAVDVRNMQVRWRVGGQQKVRPFEAFSSGEQAFAYARARIMALPEPPPAAHTLLVLDEFGAFLAADRLATLVRYLHSEALGRRVTQVLLILPLGQDYASAARTAKGEAAKSLRARAAAIAVNHYFAEPYREHL